MQRIPTAAGLALALHSRRTLQRAKSHRRDSGGSSGPCEEKDETFVLQDAQGYRQHPQWSHAAAGSEGLGGSPEPPAVQAQLRLRLSLPHIPVLLDEGEGTSLSEECHGQITDALQHFNCYHKTKAPAGSDLQ